MDGTSGNVDVEDLATMGSDIYVLPEPDVVVLTLDAIEAEFSEFGDVCQVSCGATSLVGSILAVEDAVAFLF